MRECDECKQLKEKLANTQKVLDQAVSLLAEWAVAVDLDASWDGWDDHYKAVRYVKSDAHPDSIDGLLKAKYESVWPVQCCRCKEYKDGMMQDDMPDAVCQSCVDANSGMFGVFGKGFDTRFLEAQNNEKN